MPTALITGITGQDGSYLSELLLGKGYAVHGIVRRASMFNRSRIEHLRSDPAIYGNRLFLEYADLDDATTLRRLIKRIRPDELYHLAGQSHVGLSFEIPESTCDDVARGTLTLLEICRDQDYPIRFYHASSSEIFGRPECAPQTEETPRRPTSPYGCAKVFATDLCQVYREAYGLFVCSGIVYNHESPRRGETFVTRKITRSVARIREGLQETLAMGNIDSRRDWGYAPEYTEAMWRILQQDRPDDYVCATNETHTVREFIDAAFRHHGIELEFRGEGVDEVGIEKGTEKVRVRIDPHYFRPTEAGLLVGNPARAKEKLGWQPKVCFEGLVAIMAEADWNLARNEKLKAHP